MIYKNTYAIAVFFERKIKIRFYYLYKTDNNNLFNSALHSGQPFKKKNSYQEQIYNKMPQSFA